MYRSLLVLSVLALSPAMPAAAQSKSLTQGPHRMELTLERKSTAGWRVVDPGFIFAKSDNIRFRFKTNFSGYLYVMNQGTAGTYSKLFPREDTGMANRVETGKDYVVPATEGSFRVDGPPGHDVVYWVVSPIDMEGGSRSYTPLPPAPPMTAKMKATLTPRCDDSILRARGDCVDSSAGPQAVPDASQLPENIKPAAGATSQDLMFMKKQKSSVISSPVPLSGPVIFEFRLAHK
ncbi:MAG TPA: DUF4384 domain-containing protein [Bryobacteraceae bacterium]|nr:DUF4384 domain-containing protein [Bryobacteraceae bacterium]